jgi:bisphosphoglycerate-independent phosphoglycerate mutase (AlkP superfamily)
MPWAVAQMEMIDAVLQGLLETWDDGEGLILLTSDHGNMEDLAVRRHTANPVPLLLFGQREARKRFAQGMGDLSGIAPAIEKMVSEE